MRTLILLSMLLSSTAWAVLAKDVEPEKYNRPKEPDTIMCPDGSYVYGTVCNLCPDGHYVGHENCSYGADGVYR